MMKPYLFVFLGVMLVLASCSEDAFVPIGHHDNVDDNNNDDDGNDDIDDDSVTLPADMGGIHTPFIKGATAAPYGFYLYTPSCYSSGDCPELPLIVFLHGSGERGDSETDPGQLEKVLNNGPPRLIEDKEWDPSFPAIVASPQSEGWWQPDKIHEFIQFLIDHYPVNTRRIYVTGLSMGGYGAFDYAAYGKESFAAAVVPICGGGRLNMADKMAELPIWAFHGLEDRNVDPQNSINTIAAINAQEPPVRARLTLYPGVAHNSWSITYDGTGMGKESADSDPFDVEIYDWMFRYEKEAGESPLGLE